MIWTLYNFLGPTCTYLFLIYELRWKIRTFWRTVLIRDKIRKFCETAPVFPSTSVVLCSVNRPTFLLPLFPQLPLVINQSQLQDLFHEFPTGSRHRKIAKHVSDNICTATYCTYVHGINTVSEKGRPIHTNYIKSSFQSVNLQIQLGNITPVICVPSEPISCAVTTTTTFPQRLSADKLSVVVTRQWCYGPRRLWANNDNEEQKTTNSTNACQLCLKFYTRKLWKKPTRNGYNFREIIDNARFTSIHNTPLKTRSFSTQQLWFDRSCSESNFKDLKQQFLLSKHSNTKSCIF